MSSPSRMKRLLLSRSPGAVRTLTLTLTLILTLTLTLAVTLTLAGRRVAAVQTHEQDPSRAAPG